MSWLRLSLAIVLISTLVPTAVYGGFNWNGGWALHYAGPHDAKANTCAFTMTNCIDSPHGQMVTWAPGGTGRYDIYIIAVDISGIAGTRYGICGEDPFYFYGWTKCSHFEIPTEGWPGVGEANAQTWTSEQPGPHVTIGVLDVYVYGDSELSSCVDGRVGFAEFCDGSEPSPLCNQKTEFHNFGTVSFGGVGFNPCWWDARVERSWGVIKSMYR